MMTMGVRLLELLPPQFLGRSPRSQHVHHRPLLQSRIPQCRVILSSPQSQSFTTKFVVADNVFLRTCCSQSLQLKCDATPQVYQRFALLCRQYLEKRKARVRFDRPGIIVFHAGTGDDASRQVVSNQLLSLLTLRCALSSSATSKNTLLLLNAAATNDWFHLSNP
jgi:hypothetical protein